MQQKVIPSASSDASGDDNTTLNVIFASDAGYMPYTAVALASLLKNLRDPRQVAVHILTDAPLPERHRRRFDDLRSIRAYDLKEVPVDARQFAQIRTTPGISVATYYRLLMHDLLPAHVGRALYLDGDVVVLRCISEIYDTPLEGAIFAGVEDSISRLYNAKLGIPANAPHINAGVALVNLDEMRRSNFTERVSDYLSRNRYRITLGDQQIINGAFHSQIKYLPVEWNVHGSMFDPEWVSGSAGVKNCIPLSEMRRAAKDPAIIHYTYKRKPWVSADHPRSRDWISECA